MKLDYLALVYQVTDKKEYADKIKESIRISKLRIY